MNELEVLEGVAKFLKEEVAPSLKLKKEQKKSNEEYELVNPAVYVSYVPPKGFENNYGYTIPCFLVMADSGEDDDEKASLMIRIKIVTYDPGKVQDNGNLTPSIDGYKDLLNCIEKIRLKISENPIINEKVNNEKPIKWAVDEDIKYPVWSAEINFPVSIQNKKVNIEKYF